MTTQDNTLARWAGPTQTLTLRRLGGNRFGYVLTMLGAVFGKGALDASSPREALSQVRQHVLDGARAAERMDRVFLAEELTPRLPAAPEGEGGALA